VEKQASSHSKYASRRFKENLHWGADGLGTIFITSLLFPLCLIK